MYQVNKDNKVPLERLFKLDRQYFLDALKIWLKADFDITIKPLASDGTELMSFLELLIH